MADKDDDFLREHVKVIPVVVSKSQAKRLAVQGGGDVEPLDPYDGPGDNEDLEDSGDLDWVTDFRRDHGLRVDGESN